MSDTRQHIHELIDQLPPSQLAAVEGLLENIVDPVTTALRKAPFDDEPFTEEDRLAVAEADEWSKHNKPIPLETVLADFGLSMTDWERMSREP